MSLLIEEHLIRILDARDSDSFSVERVVDEPSCDEVVKPIVEAVRTEGDTALIRYARELDGLSDQPLRIPSSDLRTAFEAMPSAVRIAAEKAIVNIRQFAQAQLPTERFQDFGPGRRLGWIVRPLDAVGCYVPSGRYPLPSTLLMTAVLAQVAGVPRICVTSPKPSPEILGCAYLLGLDEVYRVGGAQAIAAMAYGTASVPRVNRIVGPGNAYVAAAKRLLSGIVGIDFVAGPTEILILTADGDPKIIAADMLAQAEHDVTASAILITTSMDLAHAVAEELEHQLDTLPTAEVARRSLANNSLMWVVANMDQGVLLTNLYAPEHLSLHDPSLLPEIKNAGTVFLGQNSPESAGDYAAGPSHVLPTSGVARLRGGLSAADFVKVIAVQQLSGDALVELAPTITALARAEGLEAHARAVEVRSV